MKRQRLVGSLAFSVVVVLSSGAALAAKAPDCTVLPTSALQMRPCNPRQECLTAIARDAEAGQRDARQRQCSRLPTSGVCHGPQMYNPQSDCLEQKRRR